LPDTRRSSVIEAIGPDVAGWAIGERVGVGWFAGARQYCRDCRRRNDFACETIVGATANRDRIMDSRIYRREESSFD
jgi:D-arabinose 1-dehydrogenase-like Zn-dependent alcohol dehydrogenase